MARVDLSVGRKLVNRKIFGLTAVNLAAPALQFVASPILTRLYAPDQFGIYALIYSGATVLTMFFTGLAYQGMTAEESLFGVELLYKEVLCSSVIALTAMVIVARTFFEGDTNVMAAIFLSFSLALTQIQIFRLSRIDEFRQVAIMLLGRAVLAIAFQVVLAGASPSGLSLIYGVVVAELAIALIITLFSRSRCGQGINSREVLRFSQMRRHKKYPFRFLPAQTASLTVNFAPLYLGSALGAHQAIGLYGFSRRLSQAPATALTSAIRMAFWRSVDRNSSYEQTQRIVKHGRMMVVAGALLLFLVPDTAIAYVFGEAWRNVGTMLAATFLWAGGSVVTQFPSELIKHREQQGYILKIEAVGVAMKILTLVPALFGLEMEIVLIMFCLSGWAFNLFASNQYLKRLGELG